MDGRLLLLLVFLSVLHAAASFNASLSLSPPAISGLTVGHVAFVEGNLSITGDLPEPFVLSAEAKDHRVASVSFLNVSGDQVSLAVSGHRLGHTQVVFSLEANGTQWVGELDVIVLREVTVHATIFQVLSIACIVVVVLLMGCDLDPHVILQLLRRPLAPGIGFLCQFLLMPLIAFGISFAIPMDKAFGFGLLTSGCSPGGGSSNVWAVLLGGDINLSMTMTFISSVSAIGMMPLWLFLLGRFYVDVDEVIVPYSSVALNLLQVILPSLLGMLLRWKAERLALRLVGLTQPVSFFYVLFLLTYGTYTNVYMYELMFDYPIVIPAGALLPWIGFAAGFLLGVVFRLGRASSLTVALETGCQNVGIAMLVLIYSMPKPIGEMAAVVPVVVICLTPLPLIVALIVIVVRRRRRKRKDEEKAALLVNKVKMVRSTRSGLEESGESSSAISLYM